jgi:hypothetical protein
MFTRLEILNAITTLMFIYTLGLANTYIFFLAPKVTIDVIFSTIIGNGVLLVIYFITLFFLNEGFGDKDKKKLY